MQIGYAFKLANYFSSMRQGDIVTEHPGIRNIRLVGSNETEYICMNCLTHGSRVTHIWFNELGHHRFKYMRQVIICNWVMGNKFLWNCDKNPQMR